jgi:hypothetical protein
MIQNAVFAICAALFAIVGLAGLMIWGSSCARMLAISAAFMACLGQFVGQDPHRLARPASITLSYLGFGMVVLALIYF